ncbi:DUF3253 domain-containing protein [Roseomonas elaeocarpi]|uniref:DUF3253 domain-containing protein n=1 Tax=Roseomonas elaeocarpi TaxID=907779 RepID=A0ABV6K2T9_9PROT
MADPMSGPDDAAIEATILRLATERGAAASICPSEVARDLRGEDWRPLMTPVRRAAVRMAKRGEIEVLRKGKPVADLDELRGVIRLRIVASA